MKKFNLKDLSVRDFDEIRTAALADFIRTPESSQPKLIIAAFLVHLERKGYKIVPKDGSSD